MEKTQINETAEDYDDVIQFTEMALEELRELDAVF